MNFVKTVARLLLEQELLNTAPRPPRYMPVNASRVLELAQDVITSTFPYGAIAEALYGAALGALKVAIAEEFLPSTFDVRALADRIAKNGANGVAIVLGIEPTKLERSRG